MTFTRRDRRAWRIIFWIGVASAIVSAYFGYAVRPPDSSPLWAALTGKLPVKGRAVAVVCSGGNVDHATFARALSRRST